MTMLLAFHLLLTSFICGTLLALFTCCRKKAKNVDATGKSQMSVASPSARTAVYDSKSIKQTKEKKKNKPTKKEDGVSTSSDGFPLFPLIKPENSTVVCTLSASAESLKKRTEASTMKSTTKSIYKSDPMDTKTAKDFISLPENAEVVSEEEKSKKATKDPKTMVSKEEMKEKGNVETSNDAKTPKVEPPKTEASKEETPKATSTATKTNSKEDQAKKMDKKSQRERSTEASSLTKSGTDVSIEEDQADSTDTSNKDANDKKN